MVVRIVRAESGADSMTASARSSASGSLPSEHEAIKQPREESSAIRIRFLRGLINSC